MKYTIKANAELTGFRVINENGAVVTASMPLQTSWAKARLLNAVGYQTWAAMKVAQAHAKEYQKPDRNFYGHGDVDGWVQP